ncbi:DNA primase family protein [Burkholderia cepacia]|uniref:DNA primase family protein n=1 Tax=Burkholderia cepacia TaxID=292 RepID=UPI003EE02D9E
MAFNQPGVGTKPAEQTKKKPSIELFYAKRLEADPDLAVGKGEVPELFRWNGTFWEAQRDVVLEQDALGVLERNQPEHFSRRTARSMVDTAITRLSGTKLVPTPSEETGVLLPMKNGVLEVLPTGVVRAHKPARELGATHTVRASIDWKHVAEDGTYTVPELNPSSLFGKFLNSIQSPEMQDYLGACCASTISSTNFQKCQWWQGVGSNGKSVLLSIIAAIHSNVVAFDLNKLDGEFNAEPLISATLVTVPEAPSRKRPISEGVFKAYVSGDLVAINRKNKVPLTVALRARWILLMNDTIGFTDMSYGFMRRIANVPFSRTIAPQDRIPDLDQKIINDPVEMAGVVAWLIKGLLFLSQHGFPEGDLVPLEARQHAVTIRGSNDNTLDWFDFVNFRQEPDVWSDKQALYTAYKDYTLSNGGKALGAPEFWKRARTFLLPKGVDIDSPENTRRAPTDKLGSRPRLMRLRIDGVAPFFRGRESNEDLPPQTAKQAALESCVKDAVKAVRAVLGTPDGPIKQDAMLTTIKDLPLAVGLDEVRIEAVIGGVMDQLRLQVEVMDGVAMLVRKPLPTMSMNPSDPFAAFTPAADPVEQDKPSA